VLTPVNVIWCRIILAVVRPNALIRVLLLFPLVFPGTGCYVTSERSIVGTYKAETPCVTITLVVNNDHSFVQSARTASGDTRQITGKWSLHEWSTGDKTVDFDHFLDFIYDEHGGQETGGTIFRPERWPRGILLGPIIVKCPESDYKTDYVK